MKQLILNALKAKFTGVSDAILDRVAIKLAQTVTQTEQVQTVVDGVTFQQVLESYGDSRATQAQQTAVHNYEQKYGLRDGVKVDDQQRQAGATTQTTNNQQQSGTQKEDIPEWAKAVIESNKQLVDRMNKMDNERTTATRRQQIEKLIEGLPENLKKAYGRTPVDGLTDEEFNALTTEITTEVNGITTEIQQRGAKFGTPSAQGGNHNGNELTDDQIKAIENRGFGSGNQPF